MSGSVSVIPRPVHVETKEGHFTLTETTRVCAAADAVGEARFLAEALRPATGFCLPVSVCKGCECQDCMNLRLAEGLSDEEYVLDVTDNSVKIKATTTKGLFYGVQTLLQLLPADIFRDANISSRPWVIPCVHIRDRPRFRWRGMHLDSCRHFMPKEFVKKYIDLLALHKMNSFHWHLTEDQGWRIEVKKYPKLTEISAWRNETVIGHDNNNPRIFDGRCHGGFYTQDDIREIVGYAARRHINIVPEIEMPGHTQAVLAAYPELACTDGPFFTRTHWGVSYDVFCAGNEQTFDFLQDVLTEVMELFPSPYIHIGGDECPKRRWRECPKCQARIRNANLKNERELQSYFIKRIEAFLQEKGRKLIGWDEILEGGLAPNATVMSWRGTEGGIRAAHAKHDVVFTPTSYTYFDYCQSDDPFAEPIAIGGYLPLEKVYSYDPIPEEMVSYRAHHVLGAQGQLWTEYIPTPKQAEYMAFPRLTALSEVLWSPKEKKDYASFLLHLQSHLKRLDALDVYYRPLSRTEGTVESSH